jgi:hypothetical protein
MLSRDRVESKFTRCRRGELDESSGSRRSLWENPRIPRRRFPEGAGLMDSRGFP